MDVENTLSHWSCSSFNFCMLHRPETNVGARGEAKNFLRGPKFFKPCPTNFSREDEEFFRGLRPPASGYGPGVSCYM